MNQAGLDGATSGNERAASEAPAQPRDVATDQPAAAVEQSGAHLAVGVVRLAGSQALPRVSPTPRSRAARSEPPQIRSRLGEPAGVLSWEREFLLPIAVDVLEDFVRAADEKDK